MVKVKICGITNKEDALASVRAGCDALGFMFYTKSPRYISPKKAREIIRLLPAYITTIGVFVNCNEACIRRIAKMCRLTMLQFHGDESPEFCKRFKNSKVIKAFRVKKEIQPNDVLRYKTFAYLFDTFVPAQRGGTGKTFNWKVIDCLKGIQQPIFLSGGLNAKNARRAIKTAHPHWVDASSSLECLPGKKDIKKVQAFVKAAKGRV